ncbi:alpha/beta hydrolase [Paenibacillus taichungensis]|uniref:alpha/beta hydrolase n=1 Tax=Paenibacillus taichungensis TaxID=484184 RepID=UPI003D9A61AD
MQTTTIKLTNPGVELKGYVLDPSKEMPNAQIRPAVLIFPGGAYRACSEREGEPVAMAFLAEGYHAFTLKYSINEHAAFPKPLNDAEEALELIRENSSGWGIDPDKIAVCGFSAGGHLAAALGTMGRIRPNGLILGYPCIEDTISDILPAPVPGVDKKVDERTPPAFIFHTFEDQLVPVKNALAFANALDLARIPFELHIFQRGTHGLSLAKPHTSGGLRSMAEPAVAQWFQLCTTWLKNIFGEFVADRDQLWNENISEYSLDVQLGVLWKDEACRERIQEAIPAFREAPPQDALGIPLRLILEYAPDLLTDEATITLDHELKRIPLNF